MVALMLAVVIAAPAAVLACIPEANPTMRARTLVSAADELPGGG